MAAAEQPMPRVRTSALKLPDVPKLVQLDIEARAREGKKKYGVRLQPHNGRDALIDVYQELLDGAQYIRQLIYERDGK